MITDDLPASDLELNIMALNAIEKWKPGATIGDLRTAVADRDTALVNRLRVRDWKEVREALASIAPSAPIDFAARRWNDGSKEPAEFTPREALLAALRRIDNGEVTPTHVIICMGQPDDSGVRTHYTQAGALDAFGQVGLLTIIAQRIWRPNE